MSIYKPDGKTMEVYCDRCNRKSELTFSQRDALLMFMRNLGWDFSPGNEAKCPNCQVKGAYA